MWERRTRLCERRYTIYSFLEIWVLTDCSAHAAAAIQKWTVVIERTGASRFPVEQAREQQTAAKSMLVALQALNTAEDEPPIDPALKDM